MTHCNHCTLNLFCLIDVSLPSLTHIKLTKKEVLQLEGSTFSKLYVVRSGLLKVYTAHSVGHEIIRNFYFPGEVYGFEAIATKQYQNSAAAIVDTELCAISYVDFLNLLHQKSDLQTYLIHLLSQHLNRGFYLVSSTASQRLAAFLIDLNVRLHYGKLNSSFNCFISRDDIGNYLSLTAETVSRLLGRFCRARIISINKKEIRILKLDKLQQMALDNKV